MLSNKENLKGLVGRGAVVRGWAVKLQLGSFSCPKESLVFSCEICLTF